MPVPGNSYPIQLLGAGGQPVLPVAETLQFGSGATATLYDEGNTAQVQTLAAGGVAMAHLPTSDPAVAGQLYTNMGAVMVSAG